NLSLKIIRGGTSCYTVAMCAQAGHEDAMLSFRDASVEKILKLGEWIRKLKGTVKPRLTAAKTSASN
ncbi:MAG: carbon monoxide dehydrogenase, partial [Nitrospira sp. CR1.2]|nr:carbon monoxide dehydrogenase [Nitrospira sp. CR1.2]